MTAAVNVLPRRWSATDRMRDPDHVTGSRWYRYGASRVPILRSGHHGRQEGRVAYILQV